MASMLVCFGSQRNTFRCFELHGDTHAYPPLCTYTHTHTCTHTRVCVIPGLDKLANEVNLSHGVRPVLSIQHTPPSVSPHQSFFLLVFFWCSLSDHHLPSPTFTFPLPPKMEGKKTKKHNNNCLQVITCMPSFQLQQEIICSMCEVLYVQCWSCLVNLKVVDVCSLCKSPTFHWSPHHERVDYVYICSMDSRAMELAWWYDSDAEGPV